MPPRARTRTPSAQEPHACTNIPKPLGDLLPGGRHVPGQLTELLRLRLQDCRDDVPTADTVAKVLQLGPRGFQAAEHVHHTGVLLLQCGELLSYVKKTWRQPGGR